MTFYIFFNKQEFNYYSTRDTIPEDHTIGEQQFTNFWTSKGYAALEQLIETGEEKYLNDIIIVNSNYKIYTIYEFLNYLTPLKIITEWKH
jgi:hypothetical protein